MDDDIIPIIKFIGKIQKGEKINVKHMNTHQDSIWTKLIRSFVYTDTRSNAYTFIQNSIRKGFEIFHHHLSGATMFDKALCHNLLIDLRQCKQGLLNLRETYVEDLMFCCRMDALIQDTDARLDSLEITLKLNKKDETKDSRK